MKKLILIGLVDIALMIFSALGLVDIGDYYIPWDAQVVRDLKTRVREGPSTSYEILYLLPDEPIRATARIVGKMNDWYFLESEQGEPCTGCKFSTREDMDKQCKTSEKYECVLGGMARMDTMEKVPTGEPEIARIGNYMIANPPWIPILAVVSLWWWPRVRGWLWNERYKSLFEKRCKPPIEEKPHPAKADDGESPT